MSKVLYIQASPRAERSYSVKAADAFVEAYRNSHPQDEVHTVNLFDKDIPAFDGFKLDAKYKVLRGEDPTSDEKKAWESITTVIEEFKSYDKYVFAVPMWNFGIPYRLKQYLDVIIQPGQTFSYCPGEGYKGLVTGKPVFVAYARGGEYKGDYAAYDMQKTYFDAALGFIGFSNVKSVVIEPTLMGGPETANARLDDAIKNAVEAAQTF
jgi:FMN-dependent NADH-azoreductase